MPGLIEIQRYYHNYRSQTGSADLEMLRSKAALDQLLASEKNELRTLNGDKLKERSKFYTLEKERLSGKLDDFTSTKKNDRKNWTYVVGNFFTELDPSVMVRELDDAFPLLLFPLRLETRFKTIDGKKQLWLRVYPDDCNINNLETLLSESEVQNAKTFWINYWKAGGVEAEERAAWRSLVSSHGAGRSNWIINEFKPQNSQPSKPDSSYKILVIDSALPLSDSEWSATSAYWAAVWLAKGDAAKINLAKNALVAASSQAKADEITNAFVPLNISDDPTDTSLNKIRLEKIIFPNYTPKLASWTQAAKAEALPDKFVAILFHKNKPRQHVFSYAVADYLPTSPDPSLDKSKQVKKDAEGNIILNEELQWMVDFDKAEKAGMATRITLDPQEATDGFEKLLVIGIRFRANEKEGQNQLEDLFSNHYYSKQGLSLVRQGTPTNNTEGDPSGYTWNDNADEAYDSLFKNSEAYVDADDLIEKKDGEKLLDCLGINPAFGKTVSGANGLDQLEANAMNTALFPATLGYFMEEMMHPLFSESEMEATRVFFSNFVSGRGPVPAIRIGNQPYGILPVTAFSRLDFSKRQNSRLALRNEEPFLLKLHRLVSEIDTSWDQLTPNLSHLQKEGDPHQHLLDVIGLHPTSVEFHQRYSQSLQQLYNTLAYRFGSSFASIISNDISQRGARILSDLGLDPGLELPVLSKYFMGKPNLMGGHLVDDIPDSETSPVRSYASNGLNYIEWLVASGADDIRLENFGGNQAPTALLYLLLRHALMLAQSDAAAGVLISNGIAQSKKEFHDPDFIHVHQKGGGKSKFEHLYNIYPAITGSDQTTLAHYIYQKPVLENEAAVKKLKETIDALKRLEKTPTARLERLFAEHLDCCNYRIDAWKTGLTQYKLLEQRNSTSTDGKPSKGIYLGAYGWMLDVREGQQNISGIELDSELKKIFREDSITTDSSNLGYIHAPSVHQAASAAILRNGYESNRTTTGNPFAVNLRSDRIRIAEQLLEGIRNGQSLGALLGYQFERGLHDRHTLGPGEVDMFIYPLRKSFPLVADNIKDTITPSEIPVEVVAASNVVDGLKLVSHIQSASQKTYPFGLSSANLPTADAGQSNAINAEVRRLIEIHDAVADLVMAEQVYQLVQGNFERASGVADAFSKGTHPPEMEIVKTPRSGTTLTNRVAVYFDAEAKPDESPYVDGGGVETIAMTPRARAEASVNKWLSGILPHPDLVQCKLKYSSSVTAETEVTVSQKDLQLQPIDLLNLFDMDTEASMTHLDDLITIYVRKNLSVHPNTNVTIQYTKTIHPVDRSKISFFEMAALIKSIRAMFTGSKFLQPTLLQLPTQNEVQSLLDDQELHTRVSASKAEVETEIISLKNILTTNISLAAASEALGTTIETVITDRTAADEIRLLFEENAKETVVANLTIEALIKNLQGYSLQNQGLTPGQITAIIGRVNSDLRDLVTLQPAKSFDDYVTGWQQFLSLSIANANTVNELVVGWKEKISKTGLLNLVNKNKETFGKISSYNTVMVDYKNQLAAYMSGIQNFNQLSDNTVNSFLKISLINNEQTGTGFLFQSLNRIYEAIFEKIKLIIDRWNVKGSEFTSLMAAYDPVGNPADQFSLLQQAERLISTKATFPLPGAFTDYKNTIINPKKAAFDNLLNALNALLSNNLQNPLDFLIESEVHIMSTILHDTNSFQSETGMNDLASAKKALILLRDETIQAVFNLHKLLTDRVAVCAKLISTADETQANKVKIENLLLAAKQLMGDDAVILPHFSLMAPLSTEFENVYTNASNIQSFVKAKENRLFPVDDWLTGISRVREKMFHWENTVTLSKAFAPAAKTELTTLQFPYLQNDRWLAMKFHDEADPNDNFTITGDKLILTAHMATPFDKNKPLCGLLIDEWNEVIPAKEETTGIAFHYNQPNSEPPQTMLLVVPPKLEGAWKWENIVDALNETLESAKKRAIEPAHIDNSAYAQFLPSTMMAVTTHWITVATNLSVNNKIYQKINGN